MESAIAAKFEPLAKVPEPKADGIPFDAHTFIKRAGIFPFFAVSIPERPESQAVANLLFARWMKIRRFPHINGDGESGVRKRFRREELRFAKFRPPGIGEFLAMALIRQLHDQKGKSGSRHAARHPSMSAASSVRYWKARRVLPSP